MIFFDACAVRAIVTAVTLLVGLSTPPILFDQTAKLLSCGFSSGTELSTAHSDLKLLSQDSEFTFSLEWSLFKPNGQCASVICTKAADVLNVASVFVASSSEVNSSLVEYVFERTEQLSPVYNDLKLLSLDSEFTTSLDLEWSLFKPNSRRCVEKTDEQLVEGVRESTHLFINSFLDLNVTTLHVPIAAHSVTGPFVMTNRLPLLPQPIYYGFEQMLELEPEYPTEVDVTILHLPVAAHSVTGPFVMTTRLPLLPQPIYYGFEQMLELEPEYPTEVDVTILHLPVAAHSVTGPFVMTTRLPLLPQPIYYGVEQMLELEPEYHTEADSGSLAHLKQLKLYIRELILNSLPAHWAEWIAHNRLTLGLICVSVMYGSLLCPIIHYFWTQNNVSKRLSKDHKVVYGLKLSVDMQLCKVTMEKNALNEKSAVQLKELEDLKTQLRQCQLREMEAQEKLVLTKNELRKEKWAGGDSRRLIYSENAKIVAKVNGKLQKALTSLSFSQIAECNALLKLRSVEKQLEEEKQQRNNKEMSSSQLFAELQQDLQKTKRVLKGNLEVTQQKLRLATDKAIQLKIRLSDSLMTDSGIDAKDSGISLSDKSRQ